MKSAMGTKGAASTVGGISTLTRDGLVGLDAI